MEKIGEDRSVIGILDREKEAVENRSLEMAQSREMGIILCPGCRL